MKKLIMTSLIACGVYAVASNPWINTLGRHTLVCVNPSVSPEVRAAAEQVLAAIKTVQPEARFVNPDRLLTDYDTLGMNHVICIGE